MHIAPALIAHFQAPEAAQPGQRALDHPAIATQALARLDPLACDARCDAPAAARSPTIGIIVALIRMQLLRPPAGPSPSAPIGVMASRAVSSTWQSLTLAAETITASGKPPRSTTIWRFVPDLPRSVGLGPLASPPPGAGMLAESSEARDQSSLPASPKRWSNVWCNRAQTLACCQSRSRRQHVMPLPQPSSWGSISQGIPLFKTNKMPVNAARLLMRGRPPLGLGVSFGKSGSATAHNSSLTHGMPVKRDDDFPKQMSHTFRALDKPGKEQPGAVLH